MSDKLLLDEDLNLYLKLGDFPASITIVNITKSLSKVESIKNIVSKKFTNLEKAKLTFSNNFLFYPYNLTNNFSMAVSYVSDSREYLTPLYKSSNFTKFNKQFNVEEHSTLISIDYIKKQLKKREAIISENNVSYIKQKLQKLINILNKD